MSPGAWRALAWLAGALVVFALSIERLGLPLATFATALLGARAGGDSDWRSGLAVGLVLALFCSALFVWLLGLNLRLMPAWIS